MGTGILKVIGAIGTGSEGGALADVLKGGGGSAKLGDALQGIGTIGVATSDGMATRLGGSGTGGGDGAVGIGDLGTQAGSGAVGAGNVGATKKEAAVSGSMSIEQFDAQGSPDCGKYGNVVRARAKVVQNCYLSELQKNPGLGGGKVTVEIVVDTEGKVSEVRIVSNTMGSAAVGDCIVSRIGNWKFPKPETGCSFTQTFVLTKS
jgi:TonB family protein